ncbi:MAG: C2HC-type zinc finger protein, partial [bacterium]
MSLNMVANRADKGIFNFNSTFFGKMMTKLKMSKDKSFAENIPEWEEALRNTFATAGFGHLLGRHSSLMAPPDQVARLLIERELETVLNTIGKVNINTKVKVEPPLGALGLPKDDPSSAKSDGYSSSISEQERVKRLEAVYRENARLHLEDAHVEHAQSESRGVRKEVVFLESLSSMRVEYAYLNPRATVLVDIKNEPRLFEPESDQKRLQREAAWQLITQSITDMPDANWKSVEHGNVFGLYSLITSHYRENDRKSVVGDLHTRLTNLSKGKTELFVTFHARFMQLQLEMEKVGMNMDEDFLYNYVEKAMKGSDDVGMVETYKQVLLTHGGRPATLDTLFSILLPAMKRLENDARTNRDLIDEKERERKKKREEKKEEKAHVLKTRAGDSTALSNSDIIGTCLEFSETGKCPRTNCAFKHNELNDPQIKRLKELMKMKRERMGLEWSDRSSITCYACGEKGHISTHCP